MRVEDIVDVIHTELSKIAIIGVEDVEVNDVEALLSSLSEIGTFQVMEADRILGEEHLRFACFEAVRCMKSGQNLTGSLGMEILVRAACTTQISEAIRRLGVRKGRRDLILVAIGCGENEVSRALDLIGGRRSDAPLRVDAERRRRVKKAFSLSEPVEKTLLERIALLSVH